MILHYVGDNEIKYISQQQTESLQKIYSSLSYKIYLNRNLIQINIKFNIEKQQSKQNQTQQLNNNSITNFLSKAVQRNISFINLNWNKIGSKKCYLLARFKCDDLLQISLDTKLVFQFKIKLIMKGPNFSQMSNGHYLKIYLCQINNIDENQIMMKVVSILCKGNSNKLNIFNSSNPFAILDQNQINLQKLQFSQFYQIIKFLQSQASKLTKFSKWTKKQNVQSTNSSNYGQVLTQIIKTSEMKASNTSLPTQHSQLNNQDCVLVYLQLEQNNITSDGIRLMMKSDWSCLTLLILMDNRIGVKGCKYLSRFNCRWIRQVWLNYNQICNEGVHHVIKAGWKYLQQLQIDDNKISAIGIHKLLKGDWQQLKSIYLNFNFIFYEGSHQLLLLECHHLEYFDLNNCRISVQERKKLKNIISKYFTNSTQHLN